MRFQPPRHAVALSAVLVMLVTLCTIVTIGGAAAARQNADAAALDRIINDAFRASYSLDHAAAADAARTAVRLAPNASRAHRALASVTWVDILFRRGAVTVDHYLGGVTKQQLNLPKPPSDLDAEFKRELATAIQLAEAAVARDPRDLDARYDLGAAFGVQASYAASIEGSLTAAFRSAKRAYDAQEVVLARDPRRASAGVIVGTYRYVVAGLGLPSRMFAYMIGFGGDKAKGISLLEAAAREQGINVDAKTALLLIFSREGRHRDAMRVVHELAVEFPRNRLFVLEEGSAAIRAGLATEADAILTRGIAQFEADVRPKVPGERALWLYKRGLARLNSNRPGDARRDLEQALASQPVEWVRGRIHLEMGKVADLAGRRSEALSAYQVAKGVAESVNDPSSAAEATRWIRRPFTLSGR
jgi:tetratricopeptide (TPR) repeat protein